MIPIWNMLPLEYRGVFYIDKTLSKYANGLGLDFTIGLPSDNITIVSSYGDYKKTRGHVIYMEHGIGNTYSTHHPSYAGGLGKDKVVLFLNQHELTQEKNVASYPDVKNVIIGTPKMDYIIPRPITGRVVCLSFHWDCKVCPETRSAFNYYRFIIPKLLESDKYTLIMHAHPHMNGEWQQEFKTLKVQFYENFSDILEIADLYAVDNSSTMYEFAAAGRPILALNCPLYRKEINHGIRFWDYIPGQQVENYHELPAIIEHTFDNPHEWDERRNEIVEKLYPYRGQSTKMAIDAIKEYLDNA
jgi:hypothetical protein